MTRTAQPTWRGNGHPSALPAETGRADDWPQRPTPLNDGAVAPPFPVEAIRPAAARDYLTAVSACRSVPVDMPAALWLASAAGCAQASAGGRHVAYITDEWTEQVALYVAAVQPSGARKSATMEDIVAPIHEHEACLAERDGASVARARSQREIDRARLKQLEAEAARGGDQKANHEALSLAAELHATRDPALPRIIGDDITPEKLVHLMAGNRGRFLVASAEPDIVGTWRGRYSGKDSGGANISVFLKAHTGDPYICDRIGRPTENIPHPVLSMALCAQPGALVDFLADRQLRDRGLPNRFIFAVPPSPLGSRPIDTPPIPPAVRAAYRGAMLDLLRRDAPDGDEHGDDVRPLRLTPTAVAALTPLRVEVERLMAPGEAFAEHSGWLSKCPGNAVRIAAVLALFDRPGATRIDADDVEAGVAIARWSMEHARLAFGAAGVDTEIERGRMLLAWIERRRCSTFTRQAAWQGLKGRGCATFRRAADLTVALDVLGEYGWIRDAGDSTYTTHPLLHADGEPAGWSIDGGPRR